MKFQLLFIGLFLLPVAYGDVLIEQIFYDAEGADEGKEFIDLRNYGETISLDNFSLYEAETLIWEGDRTFLFLNETYRITNITLPNTKGVVILNGTNDDLVGYGDTEIYRGSSAIDVPSGKSLLRNSTTNNNGIDFISSDPINFTPNSIIAEIIVENVAPVLYDAEIYRQGSDFFVTANASDDNGIGDITHFTYFLGDGSSNIVSFSNGVAQLPITKDSEELSLAVIDSHAEVSNFLLLPIFTSLFEIIYIEPVSIVPGNSGMLDISLLAGKDAKYTINLPSLYGKEEIVLDSSNSIEMTKGENGSIQLDLPIPKGIPAGNYKGKLEIIIE